MEERQETFSAAAHPFSRRPKQSCHQAYNDFTSFNGISGRCTRAHRTRLHFGSEGEVPTQRQRFLHDFQTFMSGPPKTESRRPIR